MFEPHTHLRRRMWAFRLSCAAIVVMGILIAFRTGDEHWVERGGKTLVAVSLLLTYGQFRYETEHESAPAKAQSLAAAMVEERALSDEEREGVARRAGAQAMHRFQETRRYLLLNALAAVAAGEFVSAFGGLLFSALMG